MLKKFIIKKLGIESTLTTYGVGLIQTKAYRILNSHASHILKKYNISTIDWAMLGLLFESKNGVRLMDTAETLGVKAPFVTRLVYDLEKKKLLKKSSSPDDKRVSLVSLTPEGVKFVKEVEGETRSQTKVLLEGVSIKEVIAYLKVLETIVKNGSRRK